MTAHTEIVPGCYRCELSQNELASSLQFEVEDLRQEVRRLQRMLFDRDVTSCEDLCLEVCAGPCEGFDVGPSSGSSPEASK